MYLLKYEACMSYHNLEIRDDLTVYNDYIWALYKGKPQKRFFFSGAANKALPPSLEPPPPELSGKRIFLVVK